MTLSTPKQLVQAYKKYGSIKAAGRETRTGWTVAHRLYVAAVAEGLMDALPSGRKNNDHVTKAIKGKIEVKAKPVIEGKRRAMRAKPLEIAESGVTRFLFTCAQNNTKLHEGFWENLIALKDHYNAELHVSRFSYIKSGLGARGDKKHWFDQQADKPRKSERQGFWFDERIVPYISDDARTVAPGITWRGDANISPTASNPLSGKKTMTGRASGIFPHVTIAMESVPSMEHDAVKFNYSTGTCTMRNYILRDAGFKAEFHHTYGALLVEVHDGNWWCRQLNADSEGTIYDLDICVKNGVVTSNNEQYAKHHGIAFEETNFVEAVVWGDVHTAQIDETLREEAWGTHGVLNYLHPKHQFLHDTLDMYARNHHDINDPHQLLLRYAQRKDNVRGEMAELSDFFDQARRTWITSHVVNSNHDRALMSWLANGKRAMLDPVNFQFWSALQHRVADCIVAEGDFPVVLKEAYLEVNGNIPKDLHFMARDESFIVCPTRGGGIECGEHGDDGTNGARGSTSGYSVLGRKMTKGHDHTAGIRQSVYSVGTCRMLKTTSPNADYTHGPSTWSQTMCLIYKNGKRTLVTFWRGNHWAPRT